MTKPPGAPADRLSAELDALFVYGTLLFSGVLRALFDRVPASTPATAVGWRVAALPGRLYPGLVPGGRAATGLLISGLSPAEWRILDAYEDDRYELRPLALDCDRRGWTYVWRDESDVSPRDWDAMWFADRHLAGYIDRCRAWRAAYEISGAAARPT